MANVPRVPSVLRVGLFLGVAVIAPIHASCAADGTVDAPSPPDAAPESDASTADVTDAADGEAIVRSCSDVDWCPVETGVDPAYTLTAVWGSGDKDVWAVGSAGTAIHWAGAAWTKVTTHTSVSLLDVWGSGPNDVWAVGTTAVILHSVGTLEEGFSLVPEAAPWWTGARLHTVHGASASDLRVAGSPAVVYDNNENYVGTFNQWRKTNIDGGVGWKPVSVGMTELTIVGMWSAAADDVWVVGDYSAHADWMAGVILHAKGTGADGGEPSFVSVDSQTTSRLHAIWGSSVDDVWAVGARGTIRHYAPGAARFAIVKSPVTTDLHAVWGTGANDVWAVGDEGTVIHFDGAAWTVAETGFRRGQHANLTALWGSGPSDVWAVGGTAALHFTGAKARPDGGNQ